MVMFTLTSFTNNVPIVTNDTDYTTQSHKEFILDAYNYRLKNNYDIPSHYYNILDIKKQSDNIVDKKVFVKDSVVEFVPLWVRKGILMKESNSYYDQYGKIIYVNKKRGGRNNLKRGAIGPFQLIKMAWIHIKKIENNTLSNRNYHEMQNDTALNEYAACIYLKYIYEKRANKNWDTTIKLYNCGPWGEIDSDTLNYFNKVKKYGNK